MKVTISITDFLHYDYVFVPKDAELLIDKSIDRSKSWRDHYHKNVKDVWIRIDSGHTIGTSSHPKSARIKMPRSKSSIAMAYIKELR
jgi:hypothetical protein